MEVRPRRLDPYDERAPLADDGGHGVNPFWSAEVQRRMVTSQEPDERVSRGLVSQRVAEFEAVRAQVLQEAEENFQREIAKRGLGMVSEETSYKTAVSRETPRAMERGDGQYGHCAPRAPSPPPPPPPPLTSPPYGPRAAPLPPPLPVSGAVGEAVKALVLPPLPMYGQENSALSFGDWLTVIEPTMTDVGQHGRAWWQGVLHEVNRVYSQWLGSTPLQRLRLKPCPEVDPVYMRIEQKGISMLLGAVPEALRKELIAGRLLNSTSIMFKLFCTYQPGGVAERSTILRHVIEVKPGSQPRDILESMRQWRRWVSRAGELDLVLPDGMVLAAVMNKFVEALTKAGGSQMGYRLAAARQELGMDLRPGLKEILEMAEYLQAEAEELNLMQGVKAPVVAQAAPLTAGQRGWECSWGSPMIFLLLLHRFRGRTERSRLVSGALIRGASEATAALMVTRGMDCRRRTGALLAPG